jgi:RNA polymerase sigma factor (sigma-70 family)
MNETKQFETDNDSEDVLKMLRAKFVYVDTTILQDAIQTAYLRLLEKRKTLDPPLVYHVARLVVIDELRKEKISRVVSIEGKDEPIPDLWKHDGRAADNFGLEGIEIDEESGTSTIKQDVRRAILSGGFTPTEQEALYSYFCEELTVREIAQQYPIKSKSGWAVWFKRIAEPRLQRVLSSYRVKTKSAQNPGLKAA